jgi:hypothetical protein
MDYSDAPLAIRPPAEPVAISETWSGQPHDMAKSPDKTSGCLGAGCLIVFALPFAGFGAFMAGLVVGDLWTWSAVQSWVPTPAELLKAEARENHGSDGGTTYRAVAEYRYEFAGKTYDNDRVTIHSGSDNIGTYQRDRGRELVQLKNDGKPVTCYVNPESPSEAILFRDLRPGYVAFKGMFGLVFGGVGFGLIAGGFWAARHAKHEQQLAAQYPDEPWKWRDEWLSGRINSNAGASAWAMGIFAALWNVISWPVFIGLVLQGKLEFGPVLLVILFPLLGLIMGWWALYLFARHKKWGVSEFELAAIPGVLGGPLAGMIHIPKNVDAQNGFTIQLACVRSVQERSGGETRTSEVTEWSRTKTIHRDLSTGGDHTLIPVQFIIPYGLPSSAEKDIKWKLTASAATEGVDYHAEFETPVFETAASSKTPPAEEETSSLYVGPPEFATVVSHMRGVHEEDFPDRRTIYFPMARNLGFAIGFSLAAIVCIVIAVGLYLSPIPIWFAIGMSLFSLIMLALAAKAVFERSRLEFGPRGLAYQRSVIRAGERREFAPEKIREIHVDKSGTEVNGVPYWKVVLRTVNGDDHTLATEIMARETADRLATEITAAVGISQSRNAEDGSRISLDAELPDELHSE